MAEAGYQVIDEEQLRQMAVNAKGKVDHIYLHWSAGGYQDLSNEYHINIAGPGNIYQDGQMVVPGTDLGEVRNHTWLRNTGSIGISLLACKGATGPNSMGSYPPTEAQLKTMARAIAILSDELDISIDRFHVMTHAEAGMNIDNNERQDREGYLYGPVPEGGKGERWDLWVLRQGEAPGSGYDGIRQMAQQKLDQIRSLRTGQQYNTEQSPIHQSLDGVYIDTAYSPWGGVPCSAGLNKDGEVKGQTPIDILPNRCADQGLETANNQKNIDQQNTPAEVIDKLRKHVSEPALQRLEAIENVQSRPDIPGMDKLLINEVREYGIQAKTIIERAGHWPGPVADQEIARRMRGMGYSELHVTMALMNASPETADKTYEQAKQYGQEIAAQAITPELQHSRCHDLR